MLECSNVAGTNANDEADIWILDTGDQSIVL